MTKVRFDEILIEEGITSRRMRRRLWEEKRGTDLEEDELRKTARRLLREYPQACTFQGGRA